MCHTHQWMLALQWCHGVSNHRHLDCLLNHLFRCRWEKTSKLHVTGLCEGNLPVTGGFPLQRASKVGNVSIWWCHHGLSLAHLTGPCGTKMSSKMSCQPIAWRDFFISHSQLVNYPYKKWWEIFHQKSWRTKKSPFSTNQWSLGGHETSPFSTNPWSLCDLLKKNPCRHAVRECVDYCSEVPFYGVNPHNTKP